MRYKLLALDIDDTVTVDGSHEASFTVRNALKLASKKINISFITARSIQGFFDFLDLIDLPAQYNIVENGAKALRPDRSIVYERHISPSQVQDILNTASPYSTEPGFLSEEHWQDGVVIDSNVTGLSFSCKKHNVDLLKQSISKLEDKYAIYSGRHWTDPNLAAILLFHKDATKGFGMEYIQKQLGITKEETIAVGDGMTDLSMFEAAGLKVAMENGEDYLKAQADYICPSVKKGGLVEVIQKYILD